MSEIDLLPQFVTDNGQGSNQAPDQTPEQESPTSQRNLDMEAIAHRRQLERDQDQIEAQEAKERQKREAAQRIEAAEREEAEREEAERARWGSHTEAVERLEKEHPKIMKDPAHRERVENKIDGAVALFIGMSRAYSEEGQETSVYEERGVFVL